MSDIAMANALVAQAIDFTEDTRAARLLREARRLLVEAYDQLGKGGK